MKTRHGDVVRVRIGVVVSAVAIGTAIACSGSESITASGFLPEDGGYGSNGGSSFGGFGGFGAFGGSENGGLANGGTVGNGGTLGSGGGDTSAGGAENGGGSDLGGAGGDIADASAPDASNGSCQPGAYRCNGNTLERCASDQTQYDFIANCPAGRCDAQNGRCRPPPTCGNGILDPNEACEAGNLGGNTCATATMGARPSGALRCNQCQFDTSACFGAGSGGTTGSGGRPGTGGTIGAGGGLNGSGGTFGTGGGIGTGGGP